MTIYRFAAEGVEFDGAEPIGALPARIDAHQSSDVFLVGFERDKEAPVFWIETMCIIRRGGEEHNPLRLMFGYTASDIAVIAPAGRQVPPMFRRGDYPAPRLVRPEIDGSPLIIVSGSVTELAISGPVFFQAPATGIFHFEEQSRAAAVRISDVHGSFAGRVIECGEGSDIDGLIVENCSVFGLVRGFARFQSLSNAVLRNLDLDAGLVDGTGTDVCQIISIVRGQSIRLEGLRLANAVNAIETQDRGSSYIQGDGIVCEDDTSDIDIIDCHAENCGDAGFDLKTDGVRLVGCSAQGCKYGVRIWSVNQSNLIDRCNLVSTRWRSENVGACVWCTGEVSIVDSLLRAGDGTDVIRFAANDAGTLPIVRMRGCQITHGGAEDLLGGDPGQLILDAVWINGQATSGVANWDGSNLTWA